MSPPERRLGFGVGRLCLGYFAGEGARKGDEILGKGAEACR